MDRLRISLSASLTLLSLNRFVAGAATITSTATVTALPPQAIGYYLHETQGTNQAGLISCPEPSHFRTSGLYGYCCHPSRSAECALATECRDGTIKGPLYTSSCTDCITVSVYESFHMVPPSVKFIQCLGTWPALTLHRHIPGMTTSTDTTISSSPDESTTASSSIKSTGFMPVVPVAPTRSYTATPAPGELYEKLPGEKKAEAAKISTIIIGTILLIAIAILGLLLGRSKWNKPASQASLRKLHEAEGSNGLVPTPARRTIPRDGSRRTNMSRDGFISLGDLSHSGRYSPAQELPTVVEERYQHMSTASSPISPCVSSPR